MAYHRILLWQLSVLIILGGTAKTRPVLASITPPVHRLRDSGPTVEIQNIIDALIGAGGFGTWANMLYVTDTSTLPISATFFVPSDEALLLSSLGVDLDPSMIKYHIAPQRLSFSDLQSFKIGAKIPTLLPNNTISVTDNTVENFTIDGCLINRPDILSNGVIAVHGIGSILNYTLYGNRSSLSSDQMPVSFPGGEVVVAPQPAPTGSDAPCRYTDFSIIVAATCAFFSVQGS